LSVPPNQARARVQRAECVFPTMLPARDLRVPSGTNMKGRAFACKTTSSPVQVWWQVWDAASHHAACLVEGRQEARWRERPCVVVMWSQMLTIQSRFKTMVNGGGRPSRRRTRGNASSLPVQVAAEFKMRRVAVRCVVRGGAFQNHRQIQ